MIRWLLWIIGGVLLGGVVHIVTVLALPRTATQDAYTRMEKVTPVNSVKVLDQPTPQAAILPFMDPAFASAVCRYDLTAGPMKLSMPVNSSYTAVSFYTRRGIAFYAINDRAAGRRIIELDLMTSEQKDALPETEDITAADRLIVESPTDTGLILFRAMATEPSMMPLARQTVTAGRCVQRPVNPS